MAILWVTDNLGDVWGLQLWPEWSWQGSDFEFVAIVISGPDVMKGHTSISLPIFADWWI